MNLEKDIHITIHQKLEKEKMKKNRIKTNDILIFDLALLKYKVNAIISWIYKFMEYVLCFIIQIANIIKKTTYKPSTGKKQWVWLINNYLAWPSPFMLRWSKRCKLIS